MKLEKIDVDARYNLPHEVKFCTRCVISNQRPRIVFDPTNSSVIYAAGVAGGIFKSTDGGTSWIPTDDLMLNLAVCALVIDPTNPNVLYAGTGEGYGAGIFVRGLGIFKRAPYWFTMIFSLYLAYSP